MNTVTPTIQQTKQKIDEVLDTLTHENLVVVQRFVEFLREQALQERPVGVNVKEEKAPYLYPTIEVPASSLDAWLDLVPDGCGGDALADTEALYDEV